MTSRRSFLRCLAASIVLPFTRLLEAASAEHFTDSRYWVNVPDHARPIRPGEMVVLWTNCTPSENIYGPKELTHLGGAVARKMASGEVGARWILDSIPLQPGWRRRAVDVSMSVSQYGVQRFTWRIVDVQAWGDWTENDDAELSQQGWSLDDLGKLTNGEKKMLVKHYRLINARKRLFGMEDAVVYGKLS